MRIKLACLCLIAVSAGSAAADNKTTFFRDGTMLEQDAVAVKGAIAIPLAAALLKNTLTVFPASGTSILNVESNRTEAGSASDKEIEKLVEQRRRLEDRLQALDTREAIFTSAAKTQSGKAPRKSKASPDPMQAIRQGTDFAFAQLETVYTARRKTTHEIQAIDTRIAKARKDNRQGESSLLITVTPPRGKVTIRYATAEPGWQPQYNLHLTGDGYARLQLSARVTGSGRGRLTRVSSGTLAEGSNAKTYPVQSGSATLASYLLPVTEEVYTGETFHRFYARITNSTPLYLPPGDSGLFRNGVYLGRFRFEGLSSGRSKPISLDK